MVRSVATVAGIVVASVASLSSAQQPTDHVQLIRGALNERTTLQFIQTPLRDVVEYIEDRHGFQIEIDSIALKRKEIGSDTLITRDLRDVSLRSALGLMLNDIGADWTIANEVLLITSKEDVQKRISARAYNVSDLASCETLVQTFANSISSLFETIDRGRPIVSVFGSTLLFRGTEHEHFEIEQLIRQMRSSMIKNNLAAYTELVNELNPSNRLSTESLFAQYAWRVGKGTRYALVGFIDVNDDGKSDREALRSLIETTGGILEAELTEDGEMIGKLSIHTHYVVIGERASPNKTHREKVRIGFGRVIDEAFREHIDIIPAKKIFERLQNSAESVRVGDDNPFAGGHEAVYDAFDVQPRSEPNPFKPKE